jgi:hypothetical protein
MNPETNVIGISTNKISEAVLPAPSNEPVQGKVPNLDKLELFGEYYKFKRESK